MSNRPFIVFGIFAAICLLVIPYFALGKEGSESAATVEVASSDTESKDLFANNCGYCHTLAAAGTDGVVGPDFDDVLVVGGENSAEQYDALYGRVLQVVTCGIGGRMPKGILLSEEARQVSAFVAAYAGQIGKGPTVDLATAEKPPPPDTCPQGG
jgi:mono/diheme cytochrome c family protein